MSIEYVMTRSIAAGGQSVSSRISISGGASYGIDESIPVAANNLVALTIDVSQLKAIWFSTDKTVTLYFNDLSSGSPSKTIVLTADQAFSWDNLSGHANPFGATDVTALYVTRTGTGAARLRGFVLTDPTV